MLEANGQDASARLCAAIGVPFLDSMLSWPAGPRSTDGIWAKHWYASVEASRSFGPLPTNPRSASEETISSRR